jgi:hypothetical protein
VLYNPSSALGAKEYSRISAKWRRQASSPK